MKNIFENAYFGKSYKTRDGRKAIYIKKESSGHLHFVVIEKELLADCYTDSGNECNGEYDLDIISEWQPKINKEELNELANLHIEELEKLGCEFNTQERLVVIDTYKASFHKAMEDKQ